MLETIKLFLGITTTNFDTELNLHIASALADMGYSTDITNLDEDDDLIIQAVGAYCGYKHNQNHGALDRAQAFKDSYDEIKKTLLMSSDYTTYSED